MLVLGPGGKLLKRGHYSRALWSDFEKMGDVRLNSRGLITNLGAQRRGEIIKGVSLIQVEDYSLKNCLKRNIIRIMGQHNGKSMLLM